MMVDLDRLRIHVYDVTLATGRPPLIADIVEHLCVPAPLVGEALAELAERHVVVLQPDGELLMVPPFSAIPTAFVVSTDSFHAFANCGWDALGAAVMLQRPTHITASCADCGQEFRLTSDGNTVAGDQPLLHFPLPARRWWENVVFT